jgi:hypothetical protein
MHGWSRSSQPSRAHRLVVAHRRLRLPLCGAVLLGFALLTLALLAGCGASSSPSRSVGATPTAGHTAYAYLYSRVDYPLEIPVNGGDTVTLSLSTNENILTATPSSGQGTTTVGAPISLPTDLQDYRDIQAEADATAPTTSPIVWQLVSQQRQSLLTSSSPSSRREYRDVDFQWHVQAVGTGQNLARITLHLYYFWLDGSQHAGTIEVTQDPIPMVAVVPPQAPNRLTQLKSPLVGLSGLAGVLGALRFIWDLLQNAKDAKEMVQTGTKVAGAVQSRVSQRNSARKNDQSSPGSQA